MKGNRTVNTQKLMKKLLALPVLETMDGKRAVELQRVLDAVRVSSIAEKQKKHLWRETILACTGKKNNERKNDHE